LEVFWTGFAKPPEGANIPAIFSGKFQNQGSTTW
jgi:hypothetical protein